MVDYVGAHVKAKAANKINYIMHMNLENFFKFHKITQGDNNNLVYCMLNIRAKSFFLAKSYGDLELGPIVPKIFSFSMLCSNSMTQLSQVIVRM